MKQTDRLLLYLRHNDSIDPMTSWAELGIYRLAARISDLKKAGYMIHTSNKPILNQFGERCKVAEYTLINNKLSC